MTINKNNNHNYLSRKSKVINQNNFFNCHRLIYIVIVSLFILIGVYNYHYAEQYYEYEVSCVFRRQIKYLKFVFFFF